MSSTNDPTISPADALNQAEEILQQAIKQQHPEWVQQDGNCPRCILHEYELADPFAAPEDDQKPSALKSGRTTNLLHE